MILFSRRGVSATLSHGVTQSTGEARSGVSVALLDFDFSMHLPESNDSWMRGSVCDFWMGEGSRAPGSTFNELDWITNSARDFLRRLGIRFGIVVLSSSESNAGLLDRSDFSASRVCLLAGFLPDSSS